MIRCGPGHSHERDHVGVETQLIIHGNDLVLWNHDVWAIVVVERVGIRHDGVQEVVAAR